MERFFRTLFPGTVTVCGVELPPLTLWRLAALQAVQSPFVASDPRTVITPADLTFALQIARCGNMQAPDIKWSFKAWKWTRKMQKNGLLFRQQARLFVEWMKVHQLTPELWRDELHEPRYITAPLVMSHVAGLLQLGINHEDAWNMSPGYAAWLILAGAERENNSIKFADDKPMERINKPRTESEIIEQAQRELGKGFASWYAARQEKLNGRN